MSLLKRAAWGVGLWIATAGVASAQVQLSIADGRVSLVAKNVTVRQILAEWARVGQTRIVNGDRMPGGPVTLELTGVPEAQALDIILRSASGYLAAPRVTPASHGSLFDRIVVMPTSTAPPAAAAPPARPSGPQPVFPQPGQPVFQQPRFPSMPQQSEGAEEETEETRRPVFNAFPQPGTMPSGANVPPPQGPLVLPQPGSPTGNTPAQGASTPGMIVQPPTQQEPNQVVIPGQPRRPGGPGGHE